MPTVRNSRAPVAQRGGITRHEIAIRLLVNSRPDIHRNGFRQAVRELWAELADPELDDGPPQMPFLPDAYRIDRESEELILYEVEDSNPISPQKLAALGEFWFDWDCEGQHDWLPRLVTVDRYGRETGEIDMMGLYYAIDLDEVSPSPVGMVG